MSKPSLPRGTWQEWRSYLEKNPQFQELVEVCLSEHQAFANKAKIILVMPPNMTQDILGLTSLETKLEETGNSQLAQVVRWLIFWEQEDDWKAQIEEWAQRFVVADIKARWTVQGEVYVQEEVQDLCTSLLMDGKEYVLDTEKSQLNKYKEELQRLDDQYWDNCRFRWTLEGNTLRGCVKRALKAYRSDPKWYLCEWLRQDCAGRGGCCGRDCGCCERPRQTHREWNRGHGTSACGCCIRSRPNRKEDDQAGCKDVEKFPFDITTDDGDEEAYSARIFRAYIWGLSFVDELNLIGTFH